MALELKFPQAEPPGRFLAWSPVGVGPGRIPFANSLAAAFGAARAPRCLAGTSSCLELPLGAWFPERWWDRSLPRGPGLFASPILAPSIQLWDSSSWSRMAGRRIGNDVEEDVWLLCVASLPSFIHSRMVCLIGVDVEAHTWFRRLVQHVFQSQWRSSTSDAFLNLS